MELPWLMKQIETHAEEFVVRPSPGGGASLGRRGPASFANRVHVNRATWVARSVSRTDVLRTRSRISLASLLDTASQIAGTTSCSANGFRPQVSAASSSKD